MALRELFSGYRFRAQQNTRYVESDTTEATVTHVLDTLISRLTSADIQSTITPDEGRNVPWHYNNIAGVNTARQTLMGVDGLMDMVELRRDEELLASGGEQVWRAFAPLHERKLEQRAAVRRLERREIGDVNLRIEKLRLAQRRLELEDLPDEWRFDPLG